MITWLTASLTSRWAPRRQRLSYSWLNPEPRTVSGPHNYILGTSQWGDAPRGHLGCTRWVGGTLSQRLMTFQSKLLDKGRLICFVLQSCSRLYSPWTRVAGQVGQIWSWPSWEDRGWGRQGMGVDRTAEAAEDLSHVLLGQEEEGMWLFTWHGGFVAEAGLFWGLHQELILTL